MNDDSVPVPGDGAPQTRRARREAERRARRRGLALGSVALPGGLVKTARVGVLGALALGVAAFTVSQTAAQSPFPGADDLADVSASAAALRGATEPASRSELANRLSIEAEGGAIFTVEVDGDSEQLETYADTLAEALAEAGIVVGPDDVVTAAMSGPVPAGETVRIYRAADDLVTEEETQECEVVEEEDPSLPEGEREVIEEGRDGTTTSTYRVTSAGEEEVSRELVSRVSTECEPRVVRVGTQSAPGLSAQDEPSVENDGGGAEAPAQAEVESDLGGNRGIGQEMAAARGWGGAEWTCLDNLWQRESGWNHLAANPSSSAYGIPQSLPGSKMASHGADWRTNPRTQIAWGLDYIAGRYGTPCGAWGHFQANNWY